MKVKGILVATASVLGLAACGSNNHEPISATGSKIIGGKEVAKTDPIASMTALLVDQAQGSICTVSILSDEWVLTAAHCVDGAKPENLDVTFVTKWSPRGTPKESIRKVKQYKQHPGYAATMKLLEEMVKKAEAEGRELSMEDVDKVTDWGDVALIQLESKIPAGFKHAKVLSHTDVLAKGQSIMLAGYGITAGGPFGSGEGTLRKVDVTIAEVLWGKTEVLFDQTKGKGACHGDSGGPAYATVNGELTLFGVTSRGARDAHDTCGEYAAYSNIQYYADWIKEISGLGTGELPASAQKPKEEPKETPEEPTDVPAEMLTNAPADALQVVTEEWAIPEAIGI